MQHFKILLVFHFLLCCSCGGLLTDDLSIKVSCTHAHKHTHTHTHTHIHTHIRTCAYTHTHTYIHVQTHTHTHTYVHAHTHTHTHTYMCIHTHTKKILGKNQQKENIGCCDSWRTYIALYLHIMNHKGEHLQAMLVYKNATLARYCIHRMRISHVP